MKISEAKNIKSIFSFSYFKVNSSSKQRNVFVGVSNQVTELKKNEQQQHTPSFLCLKYKVDWE